MKLKEEKLVQKINLQPKLDRDLLQKNTGEPQVTEKVQENHLLTSHSSLRIRIVFSHTGDFRDQNR